MFEITEITTETEREQAREVYLVERFRNLERGEPLEEALAPCTKELLNSGMLRLLGTVLRYETPYAKRLRKNRQRRLAVNAGYPEGLPFSEDLPLWRDYHSLLIVLLRMLDQEANYDLWKIVTRKIECRICFALYQQYIGGKKQAAVMEFLGLRGYAAYMNLLGKGLFQLRAPLARTLWLQKKRDATLRGRFSPFVVEELRTLGFETLVEVVVGYRIGSVALREQANRTVREELQRVVPSVPYSGLLG